MTHILAIKGKTGFNLESKQVEYTHKIEVSQDVIDFLDQHDIKINSEGERIYIMNALEYIYIGPKIESMMDKMKIPQENFMDQLASYNYFYDVCFSKLEELIKKNLDETRK